MPRHELTDPEFVLLQSLLPPERSGKPGKPFQSHRRILNGIFWVLHTGAPWRDVPPEFGKWSTVYERFRRWRQSGLFQKILDRLEAQSRRADRIDFAFSAVDGSNVRAHRCAAGARKKGARPRKTPKTKP